MTGIAPKAVSFTAVRATTISTVPSPDTWTPVGLAAATTIPPPRSVPESSRIGAANEWRGQNVGRYQRSSDRSMTAPG